MTELTKGQLVELDRYLSNKIYNVRSTAEALAIQIPYGFEVIRSSPSAGVNGFNNGFFGIAVGRRDSSGKIVELKFVNRGTEGGGTNRLDFQTDKKIVEAILSNREVQIDQADDAVAFVRSTLLGLKNQNALSTTLKLSATGHSLGVAVGNTQLAYILFDKLAIEQETGVNIVLSDQNTFFSGLDSSKLKIFKNGVFLGTVGSQAQINAISQNIMFESDLVLGPSSPARNRVGTNLVVQRSYLDRALEDLLLVISPQAAMVNGIRHHGDSLDTALISSFTGGWIITDNGISITSPFYSIDSDTQFLKLSSNRFYFRALDDVPGAVSGTRKLISVSDDNLSAVSSISEVELNPANEIVVTAYLSGSRIAIGASDLIRFGISDDLKTALNTPLVALESVWQSGIESLFNPGFGVEISRSQSVGAEGQGISILVSKSGYANLFATEVDPVSGAKLPFGVYNRGGVLVAHGKSVSVTRVAPDLSGVLQVVQTAVSTDNSNIDVITDYDPNLRTKTQTSLAFNAKGQRVVSSFGSSGRAIGSVFGRYLAGDNAVAGIAASVALGQIGSMIGTTLGGVATGSVDLAVKQAKANLGPDLLNAGVGAVSSYLTGELVRAIGINGVAGDLISTTGSIVVTQIVSNLAFNATAAAADKVSVFKDVNPAMFASAIGSYFGNKLASALVKFDTIGGQLGSAVGSSLAVIGALAMLTNPGGWVVLGVSALASFVGNILGGLIGSLFGGVPRSGADVVWDAESRSFEVANLYSRKNGSRAAADSLATTVANTFNGLMSSIGGTLLSPEAVRAGNYGMWKKDYVYRPLSNQSQESITYRAKGKDAASDLINYGVSQALNGGFNIAGGSAILKRALYNSLELAGSNFKVDALLGDIEIGKRYQSYLQNSTAANALIAAESDSVFAAEQAIILARAVELGLTRRAASDWFGGFSFLLEQLRALPSTTSFRFDYDPSSERISRVIDMGDYSFGDIIDVAGQTIIEGTAGNDTIRLDTTPIGATKATQIAATNAGSGVNVALKVNGAAFSGNATDIGVAAIVDAGAGDDTVYASDRGDNVFGGLGNDTLIGGKLDDWLIGGDGDDKLFAGAVDNGAVSASVAIAANGGNGNYLDGGAGDDTLFGSTGSDWLVGGDGDGVDTLNAGAGGDILNAGKGNEGGLRIQGGAGSDQYVFNRGDGVDVYFDDASGGTPGATGDSISAAAKARTAGTLAKNWAGGGEFLVDGSTKGGDDAVVFGVGITMADILLERSGAVGFEGMDLIIKIQRPDGTWQPGDDQITIKDWFEGTRRIEWLRFTNGEEIRIGDFTSFQKGTAGNDVIVGTDGNDFQYGGDGDDKLFGLSGNDWQVGGKGDDLVSGNDDNDYVLGGDDNDVVLGGLGNDVVSGDAGNDTVYGGSGDDLVVGGKGADELVGGEGSDVFRFNRGDGRDTLFDEYAGDEDARISAVCSGLSLAMFDETANERPMKPVSVKIGEGPCTRTARSGDRFVRRRRQAIRDGRREAVFQGRVAACRGRPSGRSDGRIAAAQGLLVLDAFRTSNGWVNDHQRQIAVQTQNARRATASIVGVAAHIAEARAQATREELADLSKAEADIRLAREELTKADQKSRMQLVRAPVDGVVQQLAVYSEGAVLKLADPILVVVPSDAELVVEAQMLNRDIGFVKVGQPVTVKLEAFPFTRYGTLEGRLVRISRDAIQDERLGPVYQARVAVDRGKLGGKLEEGIALAPGLQATAEIRTSDRRVIDYLLSPIERRLNEAGRER